MFMIFEDVTPSNLVCSYQRMRSYIPWRDSSWNIFHPSTSISSKWSVPFRFVLYIRMSFKWCTSCPSYPPPFRHLNNICCTVKIVKLASLWSSLSNYRVTSSLLDQIFSSINCSRATSVYFTEEKFRALMQSASSYIAWVDIKHSWNLSCSYLWTNVRVKRWLALTPTSLLAFEFRPFQPTVLAYGELNQLILWYSLCLPFLRLKRQVGFQ
jgi:hypothetical protein